MKIEGKLHCDVCGYEEQVVSFGPHLINTPCRDCGANMLTGDDYLLTKKALRRLRRVMFWNKLKRRLMFWSKGRMAVVGFRVGDGEVEFKEYH